MFKVGDKVKIISVGEGIEKDFINRIGKVDVYVYDKCKHTELFFREFFNALDA